MKKCFNPTQVGQTSLLISKSILLLFIISSSTTSIFAQQSVESKSTQDLSFLIGEWQIVRHYNPGTEKERTLNGNLICRESLDAQFIQCTYEMIRPGKVRALDEVYYNYNPIYDNYESIWMSSTWPIKVLLQGNLKKQPESITLNTSAQFQIENDITEFVKDELVLSKPTLNQNSFTRKTFIRTSKQEEDDWLHHMTESAKKIK